MAKCKACQAPIVWVKSEDGKNIPVDKSSSYPGQKTFNPILNVKHVDTCTKKHRFAKRKGKSLRP